MRSDLSDEDRQFARRLVARRFASRLSRQSLARLTQLSEATIKFVETGRTKPTVRTIAYLLLVPELELTLEDVPPLWREQVRECPSAKPCHPRHPPTVCGHARAEAGRSSARRRSTRSRSCSRCRS